MNLESSDVVSLSKSLIEGCIILSKTKWISGLVVKQQMRPIITSYWTNLDGGSTSKCNKNFPFIIITSMLAGLTDPTTGSSFYNSFALGVFFSYFHQNLQEKEVSESVKIWNPDSLLRR